MPEQKLTAPEDNTEALLDALDGVPPNSEREKTIVTAAFRDCQTQNLKVAAIECDKIDDALNDGTITREEDPAWPYDGPDVKHSNASVYVERAAIAIRKLIQPEGEGHADPKAD